MYLIAIFVIAIKELDDNFGKNEMNKLNKIAFSCLALALSVAPSLAFAEDLAVGGDTQGAALSIGAALAIGLAALGGTLSQGKAVSAILEATGRNPGASTKMFTPLILGLVFIESLVIFSFVIAFTLAGKI